jgi:hypothetical protein
MGPDHRRPVTEWALIWCSADESAQLNAFIDTAPESGHRIRTDG